MDYQPHLRGGVIKSAQSKTQSTGKSTAMRLIILIVYAHSNRHVAFCVRLISRAICAGFYKLFLHTACTHMWNIHPEWESSC